MVFDSKKKHHQKFWVEGKIFWIEPQKFWIELDSQISLSKIFWIYIQKKNTVLSDGAATRDFPDRWDNSRPLYAAHIAEIIADFHRNK